MHLGEPFKKAPGSALSSRTRWQTPDWLWSSSRSCSERCHIINTMLATFWIFNISNIGTLAALWIAVKSSSVSTQASSTAGSASGLIMIEYHHDHLRLLCHLRHLRHLRHLHLHHHHLTFLISCKWTQWQCRSCFRLLSGQRTGCSPAFVKI